MYKLKVRLLAEGATAPTVSHPGEDLGYDLFALEDVVLAAGSKPFVVRTGIAVEATSGTGMPCYGLLIRDRSSLASKGVLTHGGVIDSGYRGEIKVLMTYVSETPYDGYRITKGDKIAQMVPVPVLTHDIMIVDELTEADRGSKGFGSSGR